MRELRKWYILMGKNGATCAPLFEHVHLSLSKVQCHFLPEEF